MSGQREGLGRGETRVGRGKGPATTRTPGQRGSETSEGLGVALSFSPFDQPLGMSQPRKAGALGHMALGSRGHSGRAHSTPRSWRMSLTGT